MVNVYSPTVIPAPILHKKGDPSERLSATMPDAELPRVHSILTVFTVPVFVKLMLHTLPTTQLGGGLRPTASASKTLKLLEIPVTKPKPPGS